MQLPLLSSSLGSRTDKPHFSAYCVEYQTLNSVFGLIDRVVLKNRDWPCWTSTKFCSLYESAGLTKRIQLLIDSSVVSKYNAKFCSCSSCKNKKTAYIFCCCFCVSILQKYFKRCFNLPMFLLNILF